MLPESIFATYDPLPNIFSGLIGAFVGVGVSFGISYWNAVRTAKEALCCKLLRLRYYQFASLNQSEDNLKAKQQFIETYPEILGAVISYRNLITPPDRGTLTEALIRFRGVAKLRKEYARSCYSPPLTQGELNARIDVMLKALGYQGEDA